MCKCQIALTILSPTRFHFLNVQVEQVDKRESLQRFSTCAPNSDSHCMRFVRLNYYVLECFIVTNVRFSLLRVEDSGLRGCNSFWSFLTHYLTPGYNGYKLIL